MQDKKSLLSHIGQWWDERQVEPRQNNNRNSWLPTPGNIIFTLLVAFAMVLTQQAWATPQAAVSTVNPTINYQGRLADSGGVPVDGNVAMSFAIFDAPSSGNLLWGPETHATVPVADGLFNAGLGSLTGGGIPATVWQGGDRYLQITVAGETLAPREMIRSVPTAITSEHALTADLALTVPDNSITLDKLNVSILRLLGQKTCQTCAIVTETVSPGWTPVKGQNASDQVEVTVMTQGGPVWVHMTVGMAVNTPAEIFCGLRVFQNNSQIRHVHLEGSRYAETSRPCSGIWLFPDLPAGTYTFRAMGFTTGTNMSWSWERQIAVYEFSQGQ